MNSMLLFIYFGYIKYLFNYILTNSIFFNKCHFKNSKKKILFYPIKVIKLYFFYTAIFSALILINIEHISNYLEKKSTLFYFYIFNNFATSFFYGLISGNKNFKIFNIIYFVTHISKYLVTIIALFKFQTLYSVFVSFTISSIFTLFVSIIYFLLYFKDEFIYSLSKK